MGWVHTDYNPRLRGLGIRDQQPSLLDALSGLYTAYRSHIRSKMSEWVVGIVKDDVSREGEIIDGLYYTLGPTFLFENLTSQINIAKNTKDPKFVFGVLEEVAGAFLLYQNTIIQELKSNASTIALEWIISQINNNSKSYE